MNRISRLAAALAVLVAAPGLAPYEAAAQVMSGRAAAATASASSAAGSIVSVVPNFSLPAANLGAPALSPSPLPASTPVLKSAAVAGLPSALPAAAAVRPVSVLASPVAVKAVPAALAAAPAANAAVALTQGASRLEAAAKPGAATTPDAELGALFDSAASRRSALDASVRAAASSEERRSLEPAGAREPAKGPRWVEKFSGEPAPSAPRTSIKRTFAVGTIAAVGSIAITMITVAVASAFGYEPHPNYEGPVGDATTSLVQALAIWVGAALMAPLSEEAIFRGAFQGRLAKLTAKLRMGDFVVPALITSTLFVALHETADPVLFAARMVFALALSYVYKKEGILAAMAAHGIFNGLLAVTVVFAAAGMPILSLAAAPLALWAMWRSIKLLKSQRPDIKSGALTPLPMSGLLSLLFAALLTAGYFFLMPNVFWIIGAVLLGINGFRKLRSNQ